MGYVKHGPFANGTTPGIDASFLNAVETALTTLPANAAPAATGIAATDTANLTAAITTAQAAKCDLYIPAGTYKINSGLTWDVSLGGIRGTLGTKLDFTALASGTAITFTGTASVLTQFSVEACLADIELIGPGSGSSTTGVYFNATGAWTGTVHQAPRNVNIHGFGTGIQFGSQAYMFTFLNTVVSLCGIGVWTPSGVTNAGERVTFVGGAIQNCATTNIRAENPNGDLYLQSVSLDYPTTGRQVEVNNSQVFLDGCHVEDSSTNTAAMFLITGTGFLRMTGGEIAQSSGLGARTGIVENDASYDGGGAIFTGVRMSNIACTGGFFATGTGRTIVRDSGTDTSATAVYGVAATMNLLADGDMEGTGVIDDWAITADTATVTTRTTGSNITVAKSTATAYAGSQSLAAAKAGAANTNAQFSLPIPVTPGSKPVYSFQYAKPGTQTGTVYLSVYAARIRDNGTVLTMTKSTVLKQIAVTLTSSATPWTLLGADAPKSLPAWATHVVIEVNLYSMAAGIFYVDAVHVSTI